MKKLYILLLLCLPARYSFAQWVEDPAVNNLVIELPTLRMAKMVQDGSGGAIILWGANQYEPSAPLFGKKIDANGFNKFPAQGLSYGNAGISNLIRDAKTNGTYITFYENIGTTRHLYVQLNDSNGAFVWRTEVAVMSHKYQPLPQMETVSDGNGGVIIVWLQTSIYFGEDANSNLYAQHINAAGVPQWAAGGVAICVASGAQDRMRAVADGAGGAVIAWVDRRSTYDRNIYAQKINAAGSVQWLQNGVLVCGAAGNQNIPVLIPNNSGGAIITWEDDRGGRTNAYAQYVKGDGSMKWTANGVRVLDDVGIQTFLQIISDKADGAIITWNDLRKNVNDIYVQRVSDAGQMMWGASGKMICNAVGAQIQPVMVTDDAGGAILAWVDVRIADNRNIYAQLVKSNGTVKWAPNGVPVAIHEGNKYTPFMISDMRGGAIISWFDARGFVLTPTYSHQISRISNEGLLPVTLVSFNGIGQESGTLLTWETAQEINSKNFIVERSGDGKVFEAIGSVEAGGNAMLNRSYRFLDTLPPGSESYYRLKQVDIDGTYALSKIIRVTHENVSEALNVYPSPGDGIFTVQLDHKQSGTIQILNPNGKEIYKNTFENQQEIKVNVQNAHAGVYLMRVRSGNTLRVKLISKN